MPVNVSGCSRLVRGMEDDELGRVLGQRVPLAAASPEALESVLARHRRHRVRPLVVALLVAVVAGPAIGAIVAAAGSHRSHAVAVETGGDTSMALDPAAQPDTPSSLGVVGVHSRVDSVNGAPAPSGGAPVLQRLFIRTVDGIAIRAYATDPAPANAAPTTPPCPSSLPCPAPVPPECRILATLQAEMSTTAATSSSGGSLREVGSQDPVEVIGGGFFGSREGESVGWVAVHAAAGVAKVRVRFSDGSTDEMAPTNGFAVLARHLPTPAALPPPAGPPSTPVAGASVPHLIFPPSPTGTAEGLDASGKVTGTTTMDGQTTAPPQCMPQPASTTLTLTPTTRAG